MPQFQNDWVQVALDITSGLSEQDRFERLLSTIRNLLNCDASALLLFDEQHFIPLAINGLSDNVLADVSVLKSTQDSKPLPEQETS